MLIDAAAIASGMPQARAKALTETGSTMKLRRPSTMCDIGLMSATVLYQPLMYCRGKNAEDKNSRMNISGNTPCTASDEPERMATDDNRPEIARPINPEGTRQEVRIIFYRVVWKGDGQADRQYIPPGQQKMEMLRDPVMYQQFFAKLSKAVFLEAFAL